MAGSPLSVATHAARRRREDAVLEEAEAILFGRLKRRGRLRNPREAERFLRVRLAWLRHEELHAVWLDAQHRIVACDVLAKGTIDRAAIDARGVAQLALQHNACALILAHKSSDWGGGAECGGGRVDGAVARGVVVVRGAVVGALRGGGMARRPCGMTAHASVEGKAAVRQAHRERLGSASRKTE